MGVSGACPGSGGFPVCFSWRTDDGGFAQYLPAQGSTPVAARRPRSPRLNGFSFSGHASVPLHGVFNARNAGQAVCHIPAAAGDFSHVTAAHIRQANQPLLAKPCKPECAPVFITGYLMTASLKAGLQHGFILRCRHSPAGNAVTPDDGLQ